jgi:hypothetical protein
MACGAAGKQKAPPALPPAALAILWCEQPDYSAGGSASVTGSVAIGLLPHRRQRSEHLEQVNAGQRFNSGSWAIMFGDVARYLGSAGTLSIFAAADHDDPVGLRQRLGNRMSHLRQLVQNLLQDGRLGVLLPGQRFLFGRFGFGEALLANDFSLGQTLRLGGIGIGQHPAGA